MGTEHLRQYARETTPQSEAIRDDQVENSAGGFVWQVDDWTRARRFLILGAEGGTYYIGERKVVRDSAKAFERCLAEDGVRAVEMIRDVSQRGLAPKNDPALFALALATCAESEETRREAWRSLTTVARTGTHLLHFVAFRDGLAGWGRAARRGISHWYTGMVPDRLAYQMVKYRQRDGWSHADVLRKCHARAHTPQQRALHHFITGNESRAGSESYDSLPILEGFAKAQASPNAHETAKLVELYDLPREALKTEHLKAPEVWEALLQNMPMTAMIRNLANLTRAGVLKPLSDASKLVVERLSDTERLRRARVHPINVLSALRIYARGRSELGRGGEWVPVESVIDALDAAFYEAFEFIEPAGKRTLLALDVSGSMKASPISGMAGLSARDGAAAMAMATAHTEPEYHAIAFAGPFVERGAPGSGPYMGYQEAQQQAEEPIPFPLSKRERLDDVMKRMHETPFGGTDCAVPMIYARKEEIAVDTFVIYTDNETWAGSVHPSEALRTYRREMGINARLVVVGMAPNEFSIADPEDAGMLDVVGFDSSAPATISAFSRGEV